MTNLSFGHPGSDGMIVFDFEKCDKLIEEFCTFLHQILLKNTEQVKK